MRGTPDGGYQNYQAAVNQSDPGTSTDRLLMGGGSISKTGRVIWATGFEGIISIPTDIGFGGASTQIVQGNSAISSSVQSWQGNNFGMLLTQAIQNDQSSMYKYFPASIVTGKWGIEVMFNVLFPSNGIFDIQMKRNGAPSPNPTLTGDIRITVGATLASVTLSYLNNSGTYTVLDSLGNVFSTSNGAYYNGKLVVDFPNSKYSKFILNNKIYDLSSVPLFSSASAADEKSSFSFIATTTDTNAKEVALDNVILTADEP